MIEELNTAKINNAKTKARIADKNVHYTQLTEAQ